MPRKKEVRPRKRMVSETNASLWGQIVNRRAKAEFGLDIDKIRPLPKEIQYKMDNPKIVKLPREFKGSDVVEITVRRPISVLAPMVRGGVFFNPDCEFDLATMEVVLRAYVASADETFWVDSTPYKGAAAQRDK